MHMPIPSRQYRMVSCMGNTDGVLHMSNTDGVLHMDNTGWCPAHGQYRWCPAHGHTDGVLHMGTLSTGSHTGFYLGEGEDVKNIGVRGLLLRNKEAELVVKLTELLHLFCLRGGLPLLLKEIVTG